MASIRRWKKGWRAEIFRAGVRKSKVFANKQEARDWAAHEEAKILGGAKVAARMPFGEVLDRYAREVSPAKRGHRWEVVRLEKMQRDTIAEKPIGDLTATDFADWRDRRVQEVSDGSVRREMTLLGAVLSRARDEWGLIAESPLKSVKKPPEPRKRSRRPTPEEIDRLILVGGSDLSTATSRSIHAFLFAIETGMRAGEIVSLTPDAVDLDRRVAALSKTKNGDARDVPLSPEAVRLLRELPKRDPLFGLTSGQLDALFRKVRDKAAISDLHFHDSRHEATTRLSRKLDVLALAKMIGHRDIRMLMRYYDETAEDLARRLD